VTLQSPGRYAIIQYKEIDGKPYSEIVDGILWAFMVANGEASVGSGSEFGPPAVSSDIVGAITIPTSLGGRPVTSISELAFAFAFDGSCYRYSLLTSVTIPSGIKNIGAGAFKNCSSLEELVIPEGVTNIGEGAFRYCSSLASVSIPSSVKNIGRGSFLQCSSLMAINVADGNADYLSQNGILFNRDVSELITYPAGKQGAYIIPPSVKRIAFSAFSDCASLDSVDIPSSVTNIGDYAFYSCSALQSAVIPMGIPSIGNATFCDCSSLVSITIPYSVTNIGWYAFFGSGLKSVTLPDSIRFIDLDAFCASGNLLDMCFLGNAPSVAEYAMEGVSETCVVTVCRGTTGWDDDADGKWQGRTLRWIGCLDAGEAESWVGEIADTYKQSHETAADYRGRFESKFGKDYARVTFQESGKFDQAGLRLYVWHDYVAGTDPLNEASQLKGEIEMDGGTPVITWNPNLEERREYKIWGSTNIVNGGDWEWPTNALHRFFKVTVEMK